MSTLPCPTSHGVRRAALLVTLLCAGSACAFTNATVRIPYAAREHLSRIPGAPGVQLHLEMEDLRLDPDSIGRKTNGFGWAGGNIAAENDVLQSVRDAVETGLTERGFVIAESGALVTVSVSRFLSEWEVGAWSADANAEVRLEVRVQGGNGAILFLESYAGDATMRASSMFTEEKSAAALGKALERAVSSLLHHGAFLRVLLTLQDSGASPAPPPDADG